MSLISYYQDEDFFYCSGTLYPNRTFSCCEESLDELRVAIRTVLAGHQEKSYVLNNFQLVEGKFASVDEYIDENNNSIESNNFYNVGETNVNQQTQVL